MKGIAIERWSSSREDKIKVWLRQTFGPSTRKTWYEEQDYDLVNLIMNDEIYIMYKLKWL